MNFEYNYRASVGYQKVASTHKWNGWKRNPDRNKGQKKNRSEILDASLVFRWACLGMVDIIKNKNKWTKSKIFNHLCYTYI